MVLSCKMNCIGFLLSFGESSWKQNGKIKLFILEKKTPPPLATDAVVNLVID